MITLNLTRGKDLEGIYIRLLAPQEKIEEAIARLDVISEDTATTRILNVSSSVKNLGDYIQNTDLSQPDGLQKVAALAEKLQPLDLESCLKFEGMLDANMVQGVDDVMKLADCLDEYVLLPEVGTGSALGRYLVNQGAFECPDHLRPYLDYQANGISGIFRGLGNSKSPLLFVFIACIVNVFLDLLLVGVFHMDAAGAALATVAAQACSVLFSVLYIRRRPLPFSLTRESFRARGCVLRITALGAPIALQDFLVNISFLMITSIVNRLGVAEAAGIGISEKLFVFLSIIPMAFMSALSTFVAQNMGAGQPVRARNSLLIARRISVVFGAGIFLLTFFGGGLLAAIFENDPEVIAATAAYLKGSSLEYLLTPAIFCTLGYFNGMERTPFVMIQGLASAFLVRVPLSYLLSLMPGAGMLVISLAVPISAVVNLLACLIYDRHLCRSLTPS